MTGPDRAASAAPEARLRLAVRVRRVEGPPVVAVRVWLRGGSRCEASPGEALLAGRLLAEGTHRRDWRRVAEEAEALGADLSSSGAFEVIGVSIDALAEDLERVLEWAAELVLEPSLPADRLDWLRRQAAAELESLLDQPEIRTAWGFLRQLYHPHPRARPLHGSAADLAAVSRLDCESFHRRSLERGLIVAVAGEIDENTVRRRLERSFAGLAGTAAPAAEPPAPEGLAGGRLEVDTGSAEQAHLFAGHLTVPLTHSDLPALEVLGVVLGAGSGLSGRIPRRLREREGLAYSAAADAAAGAGLDPGRFYAGLGTGPRNLSRAETAIRQEVAALAADGPTPEEVEEARSYLVGREPFRRETARQQAELLARSELYGLPLDRPEWLLERWRDLTPEQVAAAARRHLDPERLKVTVGIGERDGGG